MKYTEYQTQILANQGDRDALHEIIFSAIKDIQVTPDQHVELIQFAKTHGYHFQNKK